MPHRPLWGFLDISEIDFGQVQRRRAFSADGVAGNGFVKQPVDLSRDLRDVRWVVDAHIRFLSPRSRNKTHLYGLASPL